jgi:type I restriction enzyme S subunit
MLQPEQENTTDELLDYLCSVNVSWEGIDLTVQKQMWFSAQERRQYQLKEGDLIVAEGGDVAVSCILKTDLSDCYIQNALHRVRGKEGVSNAYLFYWLYSLKHTGYIDLICNKATFAHFTKDKFGEIPICNVPLPEQNAIASFLDEKCGVIDSIIKDMNEQIDILNQYKKAVITETITKGLDKSAPMKDSGIEWIGRIPAHWLETKLKYICSMQSGDNLISEDIIDEGFPVYGGNGQRGFFDNYNSDDEVVLIGRQGALCGNIHRVSGKLWATDHAVITNNFNNSDIDFLYYILYAMNLNQYSVASAQPRLAVENIIKLNTCIPDLDEQQQLVIFLDSKCAEIDRLVAGKQESIRTMLEYKKSLIYEYTTGKKRVRGFA